MFHCIGVTWYITKLSHNAKVNIPVFPNVNNFNISGFQLPESSIQLGSPDILAFLKLRNTTLYSLNLMTISTTLYSCQHLPSSLLPQIDIKLGTGRPLYASCSMEVHSSCMVLLILLINKPNCQYVGMILMLFWRTHVHHLRNSKLLSLLLIAIILSLHFCFLRHVFFFLSVKIFPISRNLSGALIIITLHANIKTYCVTAL